MYVSRICINVDSALETQYPYSIKVSLYPNRSLIIPNKLEMYHFSFLGYTRMCDNSQARINNRYCKSTKLYLSKIQLWINNCTGCQSSYILVSGNSKGVSLNL
jgi:hypothetical protein